MNIMQDIKKPLSALIKRLPLKYAAILRGMRTYLPSPPDEQSGGTDTARYCYSVWLRHLIMAHKHGLPGVPKVVAELGPGDSLGIGLAALLTGADEYYAFDVVSHAKNERNLQILDELVELFEKRERIPDEVEFPKVKPELDSYDFPNHILTEEHLKKTLNKRRIEAIKTTLLRTETCGEYAIKIAYYAPWNSPKIIEENSIDMAYSQAVMEHVEDLSDAYKSLYSWLKPGGFMSHEIDFKSHGTADMWNGHWSYSDLTWKLIKGRRPYLINRLPHSAHIKFIKQAGFEIICDLRTKTETGISTTKLAPKFKNLDNDDLTTSSAFIIAVKVNK